MSFADRLGRILRGMGSGAADIDPDELLRRARAARDAAQGASGQAPPGSNSARQRPAGGELAKAYANLELTPPVTKDEAKAAWRNLMRKYHPDKHQDDPRKTEIANKVAGKLTEAYRLISESLDE
ncbi:J domain-containing protein [Planctomycetota bacterium]|nr:J domain-containing protein [Planctomycetota bacterium]